MQWVYSPRADVPPHGDVPLTTTPPAVPSALFLTQPPHFKMTGTSMSGDLNVWDSNVHFGWDPNVQDLNVWDLKV